MVAHPPPPGDAGPQLPVFFLRVDRDGTVSLLDPAALTEQEWLARAPMRQPLLRQLDRRIVARHRQPRERVRR